MTLLDVNPVRQWHTVTDQYVVDGDHHPLPDPLHPC
jgi:hypothetical protein